MALPCLRNAFRVRLVRIRQPHQRADMRAQREQIRPELIMQFARDLLALDVLQRDGALGEPPLLLDRLAQRRGEMIEPGADRGELRRAAGLDPHVVGAGFDLRHRLRQRLQRRQRAADDHHRDQEERDRDRGADLELGDDPVPDFGDLVVGDRGDDERRGLPWIETGTLTEVFSG